MANSEHIQALLRKIPSVDSIVQGSVLKELCREYPRMVVIKSARMAIEQVRRDILAGAFKEQDCDIAATAADASIRQLRSLMEPFYCKAVNATGIILHTGLGRAVLAGKAVEQLNSRMRGYSLLQIDRQSGKRASRDVQIERLLGILTGAEAAMVVNNNAAATAIVLNTIAKGKEVIVSRGQLVEIGGSFRLPDVMSFSGAELVEVGTTNKTHAADYENAITENTAAVLRVHPSNYRIKGFTSEVPLDELVAIAHSHNLLMFDDVGAGSLLDFSRFGFEPEPTLIESIEKGADIVTSSGDKLIGASQAGIILGRAAIIRAIRKNQFARIVRVDKLTLSVLEATLKLFLDEETALKEVPTLAMMLTEPAELKKRAGRIAAALKKTNPAAEIKTLPGFSEIGSGSLPEQRLETTLIAVLPEDMGIELLAEKLRQRTVPIFARIHQQQLLIDPRTLLAGDEKLVVQALADILGPKD